MSTIQVRLRDASWNDMKGIRRWSQCCSYSCHQSLLSIVSKLLLLVFTACYFDSSCLDIPSWIWRQLYITNLPTVITQLNPVDWAGFESRSSSLKDWLDTSRLTELQEYPWWTSQVDHKVSPSFMPVNKQEWSAIPT